MLSPLFIAAASGLATAFAWGVSDFLAAKGAKKVGGFTAAIAMDVIGAILYVAVYLAVLRPSGITLHPTDILMATISGVAAALAALFFVKGLEYGPVSLVSPLGGLYPLVTTGIAVAVFHASLSALQLLGIGMVIGGATLAAGQLGSKRSTHSGRGVALGISATILWGVGFALMGQASAHMGWQTGTLIETLAIIATFVVLTPLINKKERVLKAAPQAFAMPALLVAGALQLLGNTASNIGLSHGESLGAIAIAISATYPILTIVLALRHFKEKVAAFHLVGACIAIAGVVLLSLYGA